MAQPDRAEDRVILSHPAAGRRLSPKKSHQQTKSLKNELTNHGNSRGGVDLYRWFQDHASYLMFLALSAHDQRMIRDLIRLVLLMSLHSDELCSTPVFSINDRLQMPSLVCFVAQGNDLCLFTSHLTQKVDNL